MQFITAINNKKSMKIFIVTHPNTIEFNGFNINIIKTIENDQQPKLNAFRM